MKTEFLKSLGVAEDVISQIMAENGKDIEATKGKYADYDTLKTQVKAYETDIATLKANLTDTTKMQETITALETQIAENKESELKSIYEKNVSERFTNVIGQTKFVNDITKNGIFSEFKAALEDTANTGKADKDVLDTLIKDREGILANPNPGVNIPGMGAGGGNAVELESFKKMTLLERSKIANENPAEYARLKQLTGKKG